MLMGEYHHTIDEKNRIIIPSKFRCELGEEIVITRGLDNCLFVYSKNEWDKITNKIATLPFTKKDVRDFERFFFGGAITSGFDRQGRISITSVLVKYANLTKDCVIIGVNEHLEIWDNTEYNTFIDTNMNNFGIIAENLFGGSDA